MKKSFKIDTVKMLMLLSSLLYQPAKADVFVDTTQIDEISIVNTEPVEGYAIRLEEPKAPVALTSADSSNNKNIDINTLPYHDEVMLAASETSIAPALIHAVMAVESRHDPYAKSNKGAYGLMQLMPATAHRFHVEDKNNTKQNIMAGSKYLRELLNLFNGDLTLTLAAYNAGPAAVQKYRNQIPPYKETMQYVPKVFKYYRKYS